MTVLEGLHHGGVRPSRISQVIMPQGAKIEVEGCLSLHLFAFCLSKWPKGTGWRWTFVLFPLASDYGKALRRKSFMVISI
jgi:hypothetical protein